eukprot:1155779-Rhodomonas_salina.1
MKGGRRTGQGRGGGRGRLSVSIKADIRGRRARYHEGLGNGQRISMAGVTVRLREGVVVAMCWRVLSRERALLASPLSPSCSPSPKSSQCKQPPLHRKIALEYWAQLNVLSP